MKSKKGIVEVQFNWIFVLIVGGILIITVTSVIIKQKNSAENSIRITLLNTLRSLIASSSVSSGATMSASMPKAEVVYECNKFSIGDISKSYNGLVMFGPSSLKGKNISMQNIVLYMNRPTLSQNQLMNQSLLNSKNPKLILLFQESPMTLITK